MHTVPLYSLAKLREEEIRRAARRAYMFERHELEVTDVPPSHRRWRVNWHRPLRPAV